MSNITVVVGAQWGDEGKGKITDFLGQSADYVVRFHGGNNAGHTIVIGDNIYKLHLLPSGVANPTTISIIGNGVVIDPRALLKEIKEIKNRLNTQTIKLKISQRAHAIMPYHITMDAGLDNHQGALSAASTKKGIAPVYADKFYRHGIRMGDLTDPIILKEKITSAYNFNSQIITKIFRLPFEPTINEIYQQYLDYGQQLSEYIADTELLLHQAKKQGKKILFEGAQGMSLDTDHGLYPHTTSSNNVAGYFEIGSGLGHNEKSRRIGVAKAYVSRVGNSPFITEIPDKAGCDLREKGQEYGTTTGRPRRVGWLDLVQLRQSTRTSGLSEIALTKVDILSGMPEIKICSAYDINGQTVTEMPANLSDIKSARPIYESLPGWGNIDENNTRNYNDLPQNLKHYVDFIEQAVKCPINIISLGPKRSQTLSKFSF
ncbi:MAG: adenylosuccinate synthase [Candidatus Magasanikbacteria bacterium CG10_big_fil_rev_8_21_14_0_10_40_10]|uniref:Adenylosuccinate synthetase n=1 Tax=Candidatus Magasanikbacteria bacterium CG10_big_fil_rev_8_21_14_0_10_40_10 TaxID=1974648 RepID=A0A2M6W4H7_9BACT|nr:MAG: adenylosuccinate synthase [Candidatus Magasanikbacteria bacterium CG10_big_fil_rev_8_21_14_0_10_40_10]